MFLSKIQTSGCGPLGRLRPLAGRAARVGLAAILASGLLLGWLVARWEHLEMVDGFVSGDVFWSGAQGLTLLWPQPESGEEPFDELRPGLRTGRVAWGVERGATELAGSDESDEVAESLALATEEPADSQPSAEELASPASAGAESPTSALALTIFGISDPRDVEVSIARPTSLPASATPSERRLPRLPQLPVVVHVVQVGETLSGIALAYRVEREVIAEANALADESVIMPGQKLEIPGGRKPPPTPPPPTPTVPPPARPTTAAVIAAPLATVAPRPPATPPAAATAVPPTSTPRAPVRALPVGPLSWPVNGPISQRYGENGHPGIDIAGPTGASVRAAAAGTVIVATKLDYGYGWRIIVDHGGGYTTLYAHLSAFTVKEGDRVARGQVIAAVGSTGLSTGPHLHFELALAGKTLDPQLYLP